MELSHDWPSPAAPQIKNSILKMSAQMRCRNLLVLFSLAAFVCVINEASIASPQQRATYVVKNTKPPDDYLALRLLPSATAGARVATMKNGTELEVLQRQADGWWRVRIKRTGQEGWALSRSTQQQWIEIKEEDFQDPSSEIDHICKGILTANRTETSESMLDDGSRLIRADEINNSCLFHRDSANGSVILHHCRMGFSCEVQARVNSDSSDVFYIKKVYSAKSVDAAATGSTPGVETHLLRLPAEISDELIRANVCDGLLSQIPNRAVKRIDLNDDGIDDLILDFGAFSCEGASFFCGTAGCLHEIWVSRGSKWFRVFSGNVRSIQRIDLSERFPTVLVELGGLSCDRPNSDVCFGSLRWNGLKLVAQVVGTEIDSTEKVPQTPEAQKVQCGLISSEGQSPNSTPKFNSTTCLLKITRAETGSLITLTGNLYGTKVEWAFEKLPAGALFKEKAPQQGGKFKLVNRGSLSCFELVADHADLDDVESIVCFRRQ